MTTEAFQALLDSVATTIGPWKGPISAIGGVLTAVGGVFYGIVRKRRDLASPTNLNLPRLPSGMRMADEDRALFVRIEDRLCENTRELKDVQNTIRHAGSSVERTGADIIRAIEVLGRRNGGGNGHGGRPGR